MNMNSSFCLPGLRDADDVPHPIANTPLWSENYLSYANFPEAGIFFWLHHGRTVYDPELWQEIFVAYLPGDRYLVSKATALSDTPTGPRAAGLTYRCVKPFEEWQKSFRGAARLLSGDQLRAGAMADGPAISVKMEQNWTAQGPAFTMDMSEQSWAATHYEQHCDISGFLEYDGKRVELSGTGIRDHSWGPRDYARVGRHIWAHAQWQDGRSFMIFHLVSPDGAHTLSHVSVDDGTGNVKARLVSDAPLIDSIADGQVGYQFHFELPNGSIVKIDAEIIQTPMLCMVGKAELGIGAVPDAAASHWLCESAARFTWDGKAACGLSERTVRRNK